MSNHRISIDTPLGGQFVVDQNIVADDPIQGQKIVNLLTGIASGIYQGKIRYNLNAVQAAGTITFASFADADTVTINGVVLTGKTSPVGTSQWAIGSTDEACANNLVAKVNASALSKIVGCVAASRRATIAISSMVDGDTVTINTVVFTAKNTPDTIDNRQFQVGNTDTATANNLMTAIANMVAKFPANLSGIAVTQSTSTLTLNYKGSLSVSSSAHATVASTIVVITSIIPGQIGNLCTLAISAHGSVVSPTGGTEGTEIIEDDNNTQAL